MILLDPDARPVIGHRGASGDFPENTIRAFDAALGRGADALELLSRVLGQRDEPEAAQRAAERARAIRDARASES